MISTYQRLQRQRDAGEIDGFTLIELLIVIVVLGILAAVVIFALGGITGKSAVASCQADGATVSTALAAFNAQIRRFLRTWLVRGAPRSCHRPPSLRIHGSLVDVHGVLRNRRRHHLHDDRHKLDWYDSDWYSDYYCNASGYGFGDRRFIVDVSIDLPGSVRSVVAQ